MELILFVLAGFLLGVGTAQSAETVEQCMARMHRGLGDRLAPGESTPAHWRKVCDQLAANQAEYASTVQQKAKVGSKTPQEDARRQLQHRTCMANQ